MAETTTLITIQNTNDSQNTLNTIDSQNTLITINFHTLFTGYDLIGYVDGTKPCPTATITQNNTTCSNPAYILWIRQDYLIINALIGSISPTIIPFIAQSKTSHEAWNILANTYAKPSRGRIKQVKTALKKITKGSESISDFI
ncbi:hypothetical protein ACOSQ2_017165 [Xanthoceras sorbifolium]